MTNDEKPPTIHATGHAGRFITMMPSARLVVVRLGLTRYPEVWDQTGLFAR